ncbi:MAG: hypothetical protein KGL31_01545 [candidate division NC10 bacterium]|nr:hypothetical protein [candidate division NC10 bacterium]MDE2320589.1 hypothetical protein [candidate division NC10 bacterium]
MKSHGARLTLVAFLAVIVLGTSHRPANALAFDPIQNLSNTSTGSQNPRFAVSGANVFVAWEEVVGSNAYGNPIYQVFFRRSTDTGVTWQPMVPLEDPSPFPPQVRLAASGDTVLVLWFQVVDTTIPLVYRRSTDAGVTFGPLQTIDPTNGGNVEVAFTGSNAYAAWNECCSPTELVAYSRSSDAGATFSAPIVVSEVVARRG